MTYEKKKKHKRLYWRGCLPVYLGRRFSDTSHMIHSETSPRCTLCFQANAGGPDRWTRHRPAAQRPCIHSCWFRRKYGTNCLDDKKCMNWCRMATQNCCESVLDAFSLPLQFLCFDLLHITSLWWHAVCEAGRREPSFLLSTPLLHECKCLSEASSCCDGQLENRLFGYCYRSYFLTWLRLKSQSSSDRAGINLLTY